MKRILLLRHARSSWNDPAVSDHDRPLAPRGRKAAALIAEHLRESDLDIELVLCSSARRARETLERLGATLASVPTSYEDGLYGAGDDQLLERLRRLPEEVGCVAMIGHDPGLHDLAVALTREGRKLERFPTGALATLVFDGPWAYLATSRARLVAFVRPKDLT
jgi:phosphohistidine phosphatase